MEKIAALISPQVIIQAETSLTSQNQSINTYNRSILGIPPLFSNCGFSNFVIKSKDMKLKYDMILDFTFGKLSKNSLLLCGNVGNGKTHLAISILKNIRPTRFNIRNEPLPPTGEYIVADEFFCELNDSQTKRLSKLDIIKSYLSNDYLVLDDLSIKNLSEAKKENLYLLINRAYLNKRRLIITTNFSLEDIEHIDERLASRLNDMCHIIHFGFEDYRICK